MVITKASTLVLNPIDLGGIAVAVIAAGGAYASQRAAARASNQNTAVTSRLDAEKEAYERARQFDIDTINRQQEEIKQLRERLAVAEDKLRTLETHQRSSQTPISLLGLEGLLRDRAQEESSTDQEQ